MKETMSTLGISSPELEKKLPPMVALGFNKLYGFQHSDGGWGWWKDDDTHPFLTAYVIYGFYKAEKAGYKVDKNVLARGLKSLEKQFAGEKDLNIKAFMLYSLAIYGKADPKMIAGVFDTKEKLNNYALALLALSCAETGDKAKALEVLPLLEKHAVKEGDYLWWKGEDDYGWMSSNIETTCWVLAAYLALKPQSEETGRIMNWIIRQKTGDYWICTKTTGYAVMALSGYLKNSGEMNADFDVTVKVNGINTGSFHFDKNSVFEPEKVLTISDISANGGVALKKGNNVVEIQKSGKGILYISADLNFYKDNEPVPTGGKYFSITKTYWIKDGEKYKVLDRPVKTGEEVLVELKILPDKNYQYIMVEDPLPSGFEVKDIINLRGYYYSNAEKRDNRMVFFQTWMWSRSALIYSYLMRAERPGRLNVMPPKAELMYRPDVSGSGAPLKIEVIEEDKK
jgi:uncharacterized protein YfaS (alpha-2-macroglobulin family)